MKLLHVGTFDVANYGDLLFPLVLEHRLKDFEIVHASPRGGPPVWSDCVTTTAMKDVLTQRQEFDAVIIGGGHIVSLRPTLLDAYRQDALLAYPSLWLGAAEIACRQHISLVWNAPGVADEFGEDLKHLVRWVTSVSEYVSVRDATSRRRLQQCGVEAPIFAVGDTAMEVCQLWSNEQIQESFATAFRQRGRQPPKRHLAIHVSRRMLTESPKDVATQLDRVAHECQAVPVLMSLGPVHGDDAVQREIANLMSTNPLVIDQPTAVRELAACIACSVAYVGSSLHGLITACSFGIPATAVIARGAETRTKILDYMQCVGLGNRICESWLGAAETAQHSCTAARPAHSGYDAISERIDEHWRRLRHSITSKPNKSRKSVSSSIPTQTIGSIHVTLPWQLAVIAAQAQRVPELLTAAAEQRDKFGDTLKKRDRALQNEKQRRQATDHSLQEAKDRLAEAHLRLRQAEQDSLKITDNLRRHADWIEDLEIGVLALLNCRRWKIGNWLGSKWNQLRGRNHTKMATDLLSDIFQRFHDTQDLNSTNAVKPNKDTGSASGCNRNCRVQIVVCVHNAMEDVKRCLESIANTTVDFHSVLIVDDGSDDACHDFLSNFVAKRVNWRLIHHTHPQGYTVSANEGFCTNSEDYLVLLNSDTIVPRRWLERLIACGESDPAIGIIGPLSNAASWQSVPDRFSPDGDWAVNQPPAGWSIEDVDREVEATSQKLYPRVPLINGFCMAIKSAVIKTIGDFDTEAFPIGYGEENDYCLRAIEAGFDLAVADDLYIFHAKSRSYSHARRRKLARRGQQALLRIYGKTRISDCVELMRSHAELAEIRQRFRERLKPRTRKSSVAKGRALRVMFSLPTRAGGGGTHSVVQEAAAMRLRGVDARIAVDIKYRANYRTIYPEATDSPLFFFYRSKDEFLTQAVDFDVAVGTIYHSMWLVESVVTANPTIVPAYYVQDYEPFFFRAGTEQHQQAYDSYELIPDSLLFAKTTWLCQTVAERHSLNVMKVPPSVDHAVFYPQHLLAVPNRDDEQRSSIMMTAMIRPNTPRRGASRTMKVLRTLKQMFGEKLDVHIFGCGNDDLTEHRLPRDFEFRNHGCLSRHEVAEVLRCSEIFVDLSDYQAFGRTGLEAMACGCAVILPVRGGAGEYCNDGSNCILVDTTSDDDCLLASRQLILNAPLRAQFSEEGLKTAAGYSVAKAVTGELHMFTEAIARRRGEGVMTHTPSHKLPISQH